MTAQRLDGKTLAQDMQARLRQQIDQHTRAGRRMPGLAVILVGNDPASEIYVGHKKRACERAGILSHALHLPAQITLDSLLQEIDSLNAREDLDGILVQLPLPSHLPADVVLERIAVDKDVDGFHPQNVGKLALRLPGLRSCTPHGIMALLQHHGVSVKGRHAVVVGASNIVGRPMALELLLAGATITVCHRFTHGLEQHVRRADILVVAVGKQGIVNSDWVQDDAVVVDVGIHRMANGQLQGDLEHASLIERVRWISPVPGGVGPMTVAMLLENTHASYLQRMGLNKEQAHDAINETPLST